MQQINTPDGLFHDGNPATGDLGTIVTAAWLNAIQGELKNLVTGLGGALDATKDDQIKTLLLTLLAGKAALAGSNTQTFSVGNATQSQHAVALGLDLPPYYRTLIPR
ncbi:hypothetical protein [Laribacter hongkongensis]|uniref:hypothetical protein n=1 Tax=Laribacter hongkongensis TaxID=168471 RepID=UPI001EFC6C88|nr:hypothetical protein [Laribacter hongkongensis]MCG9033359.1 hypothetical protein [Laribacter hongkongensis]MCG9093444.1 hypothetical protein [Laribacter hongkongensis]